MPIEPDTLAQIDALVAAIRGCGDPRRAGAEWKQIFKLLEKSDVPRGPFAHAVGMRDVEGLAALLAQHAVPCAALPPEEPQAAETPDGAFSATTLRQAMRAFRARLAVTRLDDESRISSHNPLSKGEASRIAAIVPPAEWPKPVWQELVRRGRLRYAGNGCYELAQE